MPSILKSIFALSIWLLGTGISNSQQITQHTTPNGHSFQYVQIPDENEISIAIAWPDDAMFSSEINSVIPHIALDLMLNGGAAGVSPADIAANFQDLNSSAFLYSSPGFIRGVVATNAENLSGVAIMARDVLSQPDFAENWLQRIKGNLQAGVEETLKNPDYRAGNIARRVMFGGLPLEDYWSTPVDKIMPITRDEIIDWHKARFVTNGILISAAGPSDPETIAAAIDVILKDLPAKALVNTATPASFVVEGQTIVLVDENATDAFVMMLGSIPGTLAKKDFHALIAIYMLGQSDQSRLFTAIREDQRATYSFGSGMIDFVRNERLMIMAGQIDTSGIDETLEKINSIYEEFRENGITNEEFSQTQSLFADTFDENMRKPSAVTNVLIESQIEGLSLESVADLTIPLKELSQEKINDYILNDFPVVSDLLRIIIVSDIGDIEADCVITSIDELEQCV